MSVTVPEGWYGGGGRLSFGIGQGLDEVNERFRDAGVYVDALDLPFDVVVAAFREVEGLDIPEPTSATVGGYAAITFRARARGEPVVLEDALGTGIDTSSSSDRQIFVDADGTTILIRTELFDDRAASVLDRVLASTTFPQ